MKKYSAISVLVIILSLMIYFSFYFNQEKENVINCEAKLIIYDKEDTKANLELMFTLGEGSKDGQVFEVLLIITAI